MVEAVLTKPDGVFRGAPFVEEMLLPTSRERGWYCSWGPLAYARGTVIAVCPEKEVNPKIREVVLSKKGRRIYVQESEENTISQGGESVDQEPHVFPRLIKCFSFAPLMKSFTVVPNAIHS